MDTSIVHGSTRLRTMAYTLLVVDTNFAGGPQMEHRDQTLHATKLQIAEYLALHPAAADSARGIQRWWLRGAEVALAVVEQALEQLVAAGAVTKTILPDGNAVYSSNNHRKSGGHGQPKK